MVDGHVRPRHLTARAQLQHPIGNCQRSVGWYDIDVIALYRQAITGLPDRHRGNTPEDVTQAAFVCRIEVLDQYDGKAGVRRQTTQQKPERLQPTGGSTYANHRNAA